MPEPVFISYARKTGGAAARALRDALGDETCFLDVADLDAGDTFPRRLTEALLASRVFVAVLDESYFQRWYCLREWLLARAPFDERLRRGATDASALDHVVVALGPGADDRVLQHLPALLRHVNWPVSDATPTLAALVRAKLATAQHALSDRCDAAGVPSKRSTAMVDEAAMPLPQNLAGAPMFPRELPQSLGDRFVGRVDDIWRVHAALTEPRLDSLRIAAVSGAVQGGGGFGKTQLAREYLHRFGPTHYAGGYFWIDAGGGLPVERQLHGVLSALRSGVPTIERMREEGRDVRAELADALHTDAAAKSLLFVVDNVPEPEPGTAPRSLKAWCPALGKVTCLATSRKRLDDGGAIESIDVDVLDPGAAVSLLTRDVHAEREIQPPEWREVAEWVGRLPLALTLLNAALRKAASSPSALLAMSRNAVGMTTALDAQVTALRGSVPSGALRGITEAFEMSYTLLSADAQELARRIAWFGPTALPAELVSKLATGVAGDAARVTLVDRAFLLEARAAGSGSLRGWQMHRVLADFLRTQSRQPFEEMRDGLLALAAMLEPLDFDLPAARTGGQLLVGHAAAIAGHLRERLPGQDAAKGVVADAMARLASRAYDLAERAEDIHPLDASVLIHRVALQTVERETDSERWASLQSDLGSSLHFLGEREPGTVHLTEAIDAYRALLEIRTRERASVRWAMTQSNLGASLVALGERQAGTEHLTAAVQAYRLTLEVVTREGTPIDWARAQNNLGNALQRLGEREGGSEQLDAAVQAYQFALEVLTRERTPIEWARTHNNLGSALQKLGAQKPATERLSLAIEAYRAALEIYTRERAPLEWARAQNNLGNALQTLGERERGAESLLAAIQAYRAALEVFESSSVHHAAITRRNLARAEKLLRERESNS